MKCCDTCAYQHLELGKEGLVLATECRRYAPKPRYNPRPEEEGHVSRNANLWWGWPEIADSENDWCGEWKDEHQL